MLSTARASALQSPASTLMYLRQSCLRWRGIAAQTMMGRLGFTFNEAYYTFYKWFDKE